MINKHPSCKGLNIRIPIIIPIRGRGFINHGSGLVGTTKGYCRHIKALFASYLGAITLAGIDLRDKLPLSRTSTATILFGEQTTKPS